MADNEVTYEMRQAYMDNLLEDIRDISDLDYQHKAWIDNSIPNIYDSWEETMCQFFDDRNIDRFLRDEEDGPTAFGFTSQQIEELVKLRDLLDSYCALTEKYMDPKVVVADPFWHKCVEQAKITHKAFEGYEVPKEPIKNRVL